MFQKQVYTYKTQACVIQALHMDPETANMSISINEPGITHLGHDSDNDRKAK